MTPDKVLRAAALLRDRKHTAEIGVLRPRRDEPSRMPSAEDQLDALLADIHAMQAFEPAVEALRTMLNLMKEARLNAIDDELRLLGVVSI